MPITFPPEKFDGRLLSAMCTPDLRGTQGSFTFFSTRSERPETEGGCRCPLRRNEEYLEGLLEGPDNELDGGRRSDWRAVSHRRSGGRKFGAGDLRAESHRLRRGEYSPWIRLAFDAVPGIGIRGIARFLLTELSPEVSLYVTPIQIDPEAPGLPISHPALLRRLSGETVRLVCYRGHG